MEVIILKCPNCGAAVSTEQTKCQYCKKPVLIQRYEEAAEMPALQLNKYAAAYRKTLEENPNNREINLSVGACYLKLKMYDKALESLEKAMQDNFEDAEPYYLGAVALLQGRKAFVAQRVAIDKALEYLNAAVMINPKPVYYYFMTYIKQDYFERKYLNTVPNYRELLQMSRDAGMTEKAADSFFKMLDVPRPDNL